MAGISELDYLLALDSSGIKSHYDGNAMNQRIDEWLSHPIGSIADDPAWGHPFAALRFEPQSQNLEAGIEMAIVGKMPQDVKGLVISAVRVVYQSIDEVYIAITHNGGNLDTRIALKVVR